MSSILLLLLALAPATVHAQDERPASLTPS
jgi:hypothetical protein